MVDNKIMYVWSIKGKAIIGTRTVGKQVVARESSFSSDEGIAELIREN